LDCLPRALMRLVFPAFSLPNTSTLVLWRQKKLSELL
jgi:hypothetical protein